MLRAIAPHIEEHFHTGDSVASEIAVDPLGFLAGMRYTCLRSVWRRWHVARGREIPLPGPVTSPRTYPSEWSRRWLCNPRARSSRPGGQMPRMRWDSWRVGTTPATAGSPSWARCSALRAPRRW